MRVVADDYMSQADQLADVLGSGNPAVMQVVGGARMLRSSAGSMDRSIERSKSSRSVDRQVNMIVSGAETLMNQYEYYLAQRDCGSQGIGDSPDSPGHTADHAGPGACGGCRRARPQPSCPRQNPSWRV